MFHTIPCICIPLFSNNNLHPSESDVIALYLHFIDGTKQVINFTHPDALPVEYDLASIQLHPKSLVLNKKAMLYHSFDYGLDLNSYLQYFSYEHIDVYDFYPNVMENFYSRHHASKKLTAIIPLSKLIQFAEGIVSYIHTYYSVDSISDKCIAYCEDFVHRFNAIERNPILVGESFKQQNYMWYTATSRPSNAWNSFNFSALNKHDGTRNAIRSRFTGGKLVQYDYDAFHIKLLAKILDYKFNKHPYEQIQEDLNLDISYDELKSKVFQNIYGNITEQFLRHPFFLKVQAMIDELHREYTEVGYIESYFYNKRFREIEDPTPNKVFNYFLQSLETEYNVQKLKLIEPLLVDKHSVLCMYQYDAFVFDLHPDDHLLINNLQRAFETDGMTMKCSIGDNFGDIRPYL